MKSIIAFLCLALCCSAADAQCWCSKQNIVVQQPWVQPVPVYNQTVYYQPAYAQTVVWTPVVQTMVVPRSVVYVYGEPVVLPPVAVSVQWNYNPWIRYNY